MGIDATGELDSSAAQSPARAELRLPRFVLPPLPELKPRPSATAERTHTHEQERAHEHTHEHAHTYEHAHDPVAPARVHAHDHVTASREHHHGHDHSHDHGRAHAHGHAPDHGCDAHNHSHGLFDAHAHDYSHLAMQPRSRSMLAWALWVQGAFLVLEFGGGIATHSLALLGDAAHMLADVRAAMMHPLVDAVSSLGEVIAAIIIAMGGPIWTDTLAALAIGHIALAQQWLDRCTVVS